MEEQNNVLNEYTNVQYDYATPGQRFLNFILDIIGFYILCFLVGAILGVIIFIGKVNLFSPQTSREAIQLFFLSVYSATIIFYYTLFEGSKGKTLGKLVTKTRVLTEDFEPITYKQAFLRSLCRFVPFEGLSVFFGLTMWHDKWTRTIVVKDKKVF